MKVSDNGCGFIRSWESCSLTAYRDIAGVPTIGWGTTQIEGRPVPMGLVITQEYADLLFDRQLHEHIVEAAQSIPDTLSQNELDAVASLVYNIGVFAYSSSTLCRLIRQGQAEEYAFTMWSKYRKAGSGQLVTSPGLLRRRRAEWKIYHEGIYEYNE